MDPNALAELLQTFKDMAKSNQEMAQSNKDLVEAVHAGTTNPAPTPDTTTVSHSTSSNDVALANIKVPLDLGDSAEERLVNFHDWKDEVGDKLRVAGVADEKMQTTIALMWGGKDLKTYATEKAGVIIRDDDTTQADTWDEAAGKIQKVMENDINEVFAMFKLRQCQQGQGYVKTH